jgi:hypothetical protein
MAIRRLVCVAALGGTCLTPTGCATSHYTQSRIQTVPQGVKGHAGARASLELGGVKMSIEGLDRAPRGEAPLVSLRIVFEPGELGYSFDPGQVVLRTADGREWRSTLRGYELIQPGSAFDLRFAVALEPKQEAELVVAGLARGSKPLEPVTLRLGRRDGTSIDRMYWLEALGTFLAYAPYAR